MAEHYKILMPLLFLSLLGLPGCASAPKKEEGLSAKQVGDAIHEKTAWVRKCHEAAMVKDKNLQGKFIVAFSVDLDGKVVNARAANSTLTDRELESCIVSVIQSTTFPKPQGGITVKVSYPFRFLIKDAGEGEKGKP